MPIKPKSKKRPFIPTRQKPRFGKPKESWSAEGTSYRSDPRYHTAAWTRLSKAYRQAHPLCEMCAKRGITTPSEVVDHIIPVALCDDFFDESNWQALCRKCNIEKGNRDKRLIKEGRPR